MKRILNLITGLSSSFTSKHEELEKKLAEIKLFVPHLRCVS